MKIKFNKKIIITTIVATVLVLGAATTTAVFAFSKGFLSKDEAIKSASEQLNGEVITFEKDWHDSLIYDLTVKTEKGYEDIEMDASNGEIIEREYEDDYVGQTAKISIEEAEKIALKEVDGTITDLDLDVENGLLVYEIEVKKKYTEYDLVIDANTGELLQVGMED